MTTTITCTDTALQNAVTTASAGDTITFLCTNGSGLHTILLSQPLTITKDMTIDGTNQGVMLDGGNQVQVLRINSAHVTLAHLSVIRGYSLDTQGIGGGLYNDAGTITIRMSTFANNKTGSVQGGLTNDAGTVTITDSTFANNSAPSSGGGLFNVYINGVFAPYEEVTSVAELKADLLSDLQERFRELKTEGKDDETAFAVTFESIGDIEQTVREVANLL